MKIINRYVLKEHVGPFFFALSSLTSLMLLQYVARKFGDLVGRGLSWQVITEFFVLSIPFVVAMTFPMAVLVAVLAAFSRMASENEITALKAGGVSMRSLMKPALWASLVLAIFMLWFNDQVLPEANHRLATLQLDIMRTKPTFALKEQTINTIKEGELYLRAGYIARDESGRIRDVTIFDMGDERQQRTIYADSGTLGFAQNRKDLTMRLYDGMMMSVPNTDPEQLNRVYYREAVRKIKDVANSFQASDADSTSKGEREMSICEMQKEYQAAEVAVWRGRYDSTMAEWDLAHAKGKTPPRPAPIGTPPKAGGIGALYCTMLKKYFHVRDAEAAELPRRAAGVLAQQPAQHPEKPPVQKPAQKAAQHPVQAPAVPPQHANSVFVMINGQFQKVPANKIPPGAMVPGGAPKPLPPPATPPGTPANVPAGTPAGAAATPAPSAGVPGGAGKYPEGTPLDLNNATSVSAANTSMANVDLNEAQFRLADGEHREHRYGVEIQKKFSLAAACIIFVIIGAPIALRFPRGGVGLVIGVSFLIFSIYYVGLIGGESLANNGIISPFWAMWLDNILFLIAGLFLVGRMGHESVTARGGNLGERLSALRQRFRRRRTVEEARA